MALYPQSFIDDVRLQADIVQVVQETVPLKKVGATYKGLCPFHPEKTPSFHVNRDRGFFHCFGCGAGGDVFKFVELRDRVGSERPCVTWRSVSASLCPRSRKAGTTRRPRPSARRC